MSSDKYEVSPDMGHKFYVRSTPDGTKITLCYYYLYPEDLETSPAFTIEWYDQIDSDEGPGTPLKTLQIPPGQVKKVKSAPEKNSKTFWYFETDIEPVCRQLMVKGTVAGETVMLDGFDLTPASNTADKKKLQFFTPRLDKGITEMSTKPGEKQHLSGDLTAAGLKVVMDHIWGRLREGPGPAWYGIKTNEKFEEIWFRNEFSSNDREKLDEQWSRLIAEMLTFVSYSAPFSNYGLHSDEVFFAKMQETGDPAYPIISACQQLVTMATISRGFRYQVYAPENPNVQPCPATKNTFQAHKASSSAAINRLDGKWYEPETSPAVVHPAPNVTCGPCCLMVLKTGPHIGFITRTLELGGNYAYFQTFDTGALRCRPVAGDPGIHEDPWWTMWASDQSAGFLPATPTPQTADLNRADKLTPAQIEENNKDRCAQITDLAQAIGHMRKARPLGFARLVIVQKSGNSYNLLYATPLLRMYLDSQDMNFYPSTFLWSLRQIPYKESIQALWLIYIPLYDLARMMLKPATRQKTIPQFLASAARWYANHPRQRIPVENQPDQSRWPWNKADQSTVPARNGPLQIGTWVKNVVYLHSVLDTAEGDGYAYPLATRNNDPNAGTYNFTNVRDNGLHNYISNLESTLPWGEASGSLAADVNAQRNTTFSGLEYFFGDQP